MAITVETDERRGWNSVKMALKLEKYNLGPLLGLIPSDNDAR